MGQGYILAADVGGTKTEFAFAPSGADRPRIAAQRVYASQSYSELDLILENFLKLPEVGPHSGEIAAACLAVAGPVEGQRATLTNLGWQISAEALAGRFGIPKVRLVNDFAATGLGISLLESQELETLQAGQAVEHGARVVIGAGTGLGVAVLTWQGGHYAAHASEAGHSDFAPVDEVQDGLLAYLRRTYSRVSYERVVSGSGLTRIFSFLQDAGRGAPSEPLRTAMASHADPAGVIAEFALAKRDPLAVQALHLFATAYGAFAGNMALVALPRGGLYISGGIAPKICAKLKDGTFMRAFADKGRFSGLLATIPVHVVMNPKVGLYGMLDLARRI
jgi:glucokinase